MKHDLMQKMKEEIEREVKKREKKRKREKRKKELRNIITVISIAATAWMMIKKLLRKKDK